jgi:hypothetical protein
MSATQADHHDADLMIKVYDLRRETMLREARLTLNGEFWPTSFGDVQAIIRPDHPLNAVWRQVTSYWEMIYAMAHHGIVNPEYWLDGNGEGMLVFAKIAPWLTDLRRDVNPAAFRHAEWVATQTVEGRRLYELFRSRIEKTLAARRT